MKIANNKSIAFALVILCLGALYAIPIKATFPSEPVLLDPTVSNYSRWENAYTKTIFGNGTPPFKTVIYSTPQAVYNGTSWVESQSATLGVSEAPLDGTLYKEGTSYPPTNIYNYTAPIDVGQYRNDSTFYIYRGYVSFDTSAIRDYAVLTTATLMLKTYHDHTPVEFGMLVMGGNQPVYGSSLEPSDWGCGSRQAANWSSSLYPGDNIYANITIPTDEINKVGRTQFELKSSREGTQPGGPDQAEYVTFYSGEFSGNEPRLEVTWLPNNFRDVRQWWYYWNSTGRDKLAIVLFGGWAIPGYVGVHSLFAEQNSEKEEKLINDLHANGYNVISPWHDFQSYTNDTTWYTGAEDWLYNATIWAHQQGYHYLYLFGFSAGGVVAAYELQKAYATNNNSTFAAAVIASAPVNLGVWGPLFNSATTAYKVKTCTAFIAGRDDNFTLGDIYNQTSRYFFNTNAHKDWHKWDDGHDIFNYNCSTHPGEDVSAAVIAWYNKHSTPLRNPSFEDRLRDAWGTADWETSANGWREVKGDITGDGYVDSSDAAMLGLAWHSLVGDRKYDWRVDLNGDGYIDISDSAILTLDWHKFATYTNGAYSRYAQNGLHSVLWQWINGSIAETLKNKTLTFTFQFRPASVPPNSSYFMRADIWYYDWFGWTLFVGDRVYYNQTIWYTVSITAHIPDSAFYNQPKAVQLSGYARPTITAVWIDNATLTIQP